MPTPSPPKQPQAPQHLLLHVTKCRTAEPGTLSTRHTSPSTKPHLHLRRRGLAFAERRLCRRQLILRGRQRRLCRSQLLFRGDGLRLRGGQLPLHSGYALLQAGGVALRIRKRVQLLLCQTKLPGFQVRLRCLRCFPNALLQAGGGALPIRKCIQLLLPCREFAEFSNGTAPSADSGAS